METQLGSPHVAGSIPANDQTFYTFWLLVNTFLFLKAQNRVFFDKSSGFFGKWAVFLKNYPFSNVTEKMVPFQYFPKSVNNRIKVFKL